MTVLVLLVAQVLADVQAGTAVGTQVKSSMTVTPKATGRVGASSVLARSVKTFVDVHAVPSVLTQPIPRIADAAKRTLHVDAFAMTAHT